MDNKFTLFIEEVPSALAGFHAGPLSSSNWSKARTNNKFNSHIGTRPKSNRHWREASALTIALSSLPNWLLVYGQGDWI